MQAYSPMPSGRRAHRRCRPAPTLRPRSRIDSNRDPVLGRRLDDLLAAARVQVQPVSGQHAEIARQAYRDFGKDSGHPAGLNFGDCFAYALVGTVTSRSYSKATISFTRTSSPLYRILSPHGVACASSAMAGGWGPAMTHTKTGRRSRLQCVDDVPEDRRELRTDQHDYGERGNRYQSHQKSVLNHSLARLLVELM